MADREINKNINRINITFYKMNNLNGLTTINIELSSKCNKDCWCCGRRERDKLYKDLQYGNMNWDIIWELSKEVPDGIVIQFHNNGESLLHPRFGEAVGLFKNQIKCMNTNGKLLLEKADEIINNIHTLTISIIENDPESDEQYEIVKKFLKIKGNKQPFMIYRILGDPSLGEQYPTLKLRWYELPGLVVTRILHKPCGSINYTKKVTKPEIGICLDFLNHLSIDWLGNISVCVRFDPKGELCLGNIKTTSLLKTWNCSKRLTMKALHVSGNRKMIPYCGDKCDFWGCPTGY